MQAKEIQVKQFLSQPGTKFIIPVYQRNYDWKIKQCEQLLNDILCVDSEQPYFIGSIVHKKMGLLSTLQELIIIDGQQRITTLTLLLLALADIFKSHNDAHYQEIWDYYLQNKFDDAEVKLKLKPIETDYNALVDLVNNNHDQIKPGNRLLDNYLFFREEIKTIELAKKVYTNFNYLMIVEIALDYRDDPQKIFQSLNSTGLELSQADLIRNYLLMNLEPVYQEKVYKNYWLVIEKNCYRESTNESMLSYFFRDYLTYSFISIPSYNYVFENFKEKYPDLGTGEKFELTLQKIKQFSSYYAKFISPDKAEDKEISKALQQIAKMEISVSYPFLLGVFDDFHQGILSREDVLKILELIQSFTFRRFVCSYPTNALNKIFMTLFGNAKKVQKAHSHYSFYEAVCVVLLRYSGYQRFPNNDEVAENLTKKDIYHTQGKNRLYLLETLENEYDSFSETRVDLFQRKDITIEHIFPQNPSSEWNNTLDKEQLTEMKNRSNTLANLTIVINNGNLGNKSFTEKRDLNTDTSKGFKYSKFKLNEYLSGISEWNTSTLNERNKLLIERFINIWSYPDVKIPQEVQGEELREVDIMEIEDPTGKDLQYYILSGTKYEEDAFRKMFTNVISYLIQTYPEKCFSPRMQEVITITTDKESLRVPRIVAANYYVNGDKTKRQIIETIQNMLGVLEEEVELILGIY